MAHIDAEKLIAELRKLLIPTVLDRDYDEWEKGEDNGLLKAIDIITSLQQEQPSLPSGLDDAAEKYSENILANNEDLQDAIEDAFKAGVEWMAGRGFISEGIINQTSSEDTIIELNEHIGYLEDCEEVIVNIRKKQ